MTTADEARPFPEQDRMVEWFANQPMPPGFDAMIDTEGRLTFVRVVPAPTTD